MGCHLFNRHKLGSAAGANLINRAPLPAESYGTLTTSRSLQGLIVEARHASRRLQPVLLHGLEPSANSADRSLVSWRPEGEARGLASGPLPPGVRSPPNSTETQCPASDMRFRREAGCCLPTPLRRS